MPHTIDPKKVLAEFADGVLTVKLPKAESSRARRIEVTGANAK